VAALSAQLSDAPVAFVDVETTGGHPGWHRVTEVGIVTARGGVFEEAWSVLVNPGVRIPSGIEALTGIRSCNSGSPGAFLWRITRVSTTASFAASCAMPACATRLSWPAR
jgi:hypothetical protein